MNKKFLLILIVLGIFTITAVSAFSFDDLMMSDSAESENITIDGFDFNIPEGSKAEPAYDSVNESMSNGDVTYTVNSRTFSLGNESFSILVAVYDDYNVTEEVVASVSGEKETVNGVDGYISNSDGFYTFSYDKDNKLITISSSDKDLFPEIVVD